MNTAEYQDRYLTNPEYIDADGNVYDESDLQQSYNDMLDENGTVDIFGLTYPASDVLQEVDPIAYRCGMADYRSALDWDDWTEDHKWIEDVCVVCDRPLDYDSICDECAADSN